MWCSCRVKNCVIHAWALQRRASHNGVLYKSSFLYIFFTFLVPPNLEMHYVLSCCCVYVAVCKVLRPRIWHWRASCLDWDLKTTNYAKYDDDFISLLSASLHCVHVSHFYSVMSSFTLDIVDDTRWKLLTKGLKSSHFCQSPTLFRGIQFHNAIIFVCAVTSV